MYDDQISFFQCSFLSSEKVRELWAKVMNAGVAGLTRGEEIDAIMEECVDHVAILISAKKMSVY